MERLQRIMLANGLLEVYFSYQENKTALARIQREKTLAADDPMMLMILTDYAELLHRLNRDDEARALEARIPLEVRASASSTDH